MSTQRVLVLCHDVQKIGSFLQSPSLKDVQFSIFQDWESSVAALSKENFSVIVAQKVFPNSVAALVSRILPLAPKTPLILVLPENEGRSVLDAMKGGVSEVLFEENLDSSLVATLEKYLYSKGCLLHSISIEGLFDFCIPIITTTDMSLLATTILDKFREALGDSFGVFFKEDNSESDDPYTIYSDVGFADSDAAMSFLKCFGKPIIRHAASSPIVVPMEKLKEDLPVEQWPFDVIKFLVPIQFELDSGAKMYAVIGLHGELNIDAIKNLIFICRQAHLAIINSERNAQVQSLIYIDDLTKLHNFRYLNVVIDREIKRSERYRNLFSVLFMDIDFFKRVNDTHGHLVGSRVLQEVGTVLKSCIRDSDTVIRYGGDEFVILLVDTNSEEALFVAERMRKAVENEQLAHSMGIDMRLTVSIGVASFPEHATTKQHLLNLADQAMYRGKESTRNVVYLAQPQKFP